MRKRWLPAMLALLLLVNLMPPPAARAADPAAWTVLIYLCGTDLETESGYASGNLKAMMKAQGSDRVNVLVQTGGTKEWQLSGINAKKQQRWRVVQGDLELVEEAPLRSMGDPDVLADFIAWGARAYPADRTMLVLWNHGGGGIWGVCVDECFGGDALTTPEIAQALRESGVPLEIVGFDACLMATLEVAAAVAPYGRYLVASEESEGGTGWDYQAFLTFLARNPEADGAQLGKVICDSFLERSLEGPFGDTSTLSVVDLTQVPALVEAFDSMAAEMSGVTGDIGALRTFSMAAKRTENYGGNTPQEGYSNLVDLGDLVMKTSSVLPATAIGVLDALFRAVTYHVSGDLRAASSGLSVFYPLSTDDEEIAILAEISPSEAYVGFVRAYRKLSGGSEALGDFLGAAAPSSQHAEAQDGAVSEPEDYDLVDPGDYEVDFDAYTDEDDVFHLDFTSGFEAVQSVEFTLYYLDEEDEELIELGYDNDLFADWEEGVFEDNFRGVWATLDGLLCAPYLIGEGDDYNLYSIPIMLGGEEAALRAAYIWGEEDEGYHVLGVWRGIDSNTGMSDRNLVPLEDGDYVQPLFTAYPLEGGDERYYTMGGFTVEGDVLMQEDVLDDGDYLFQYEVTTVFGQTYYSDAVIFEVADGVIGLYEMEWE